VASPWPDQGAFGHQGAADAAGDRRADLRVAQVDLRRLHRRTAGAMSASAVFCAATALAT
jgi:hypothetical protein